MLFGDSSCGPHRCYCNIDCKCSMQESKYCKKEKSAINAFPIFVVYHQTHCTYCKYSISLNNKSDIIYFKTFDMQTTLK